MVKDRQVTWDDLAEEFNKATEAFERCIKAFKNLAKTYEELIDLCGRIK